MAYTIRDLKGTHYSIETEIKLIEEENGPTYIEFTLYPTEHNKSFIRNVTEDWKVFGVEDTRFGHFVITNVEKEGIGLYPVLKIRAVASLIHKMQHSTFDGYYTGSSTFAAFFGKIATQLGINIQLLTSRDAFGWEKYGLGAQMIDEFIRGLKNYNVVFRLATPNTIEIVDAINRNPGYIIKNALNADDFKLEIDTSSRYTYVEGYADFGDEENVNFYNKAKIKSYYKSKDYDVLGKLQAPTYTNQNIKSKELLDKYLKDIVESSKKVNLSTSFRKVPNYPYAVPQIGDNIIAQDESINLNEEVHIIKLITYLDPYGNPYEYDMEFGNMNLGQRKKVSLESINKRIEDLYTGRNPISLSGFSEYSAKALIDIKNAQTEIVIGSAENGLNGIQLVDKTNPNKAVWLSSKGIVLSKDGFNSTEVAINGDGINANVIRTGTMLADRVEGGILRSQNGNVNWDLNNGVIYLSNPRNAIRYTASAWTSGLHFSNDSTGKAAAVLGTSNTSPDMDSNHSSFVGIKAVPNGGSVELWGKSVNIIKDGASSNDTTWKFDIEQHPDSPNGVRAIVGYKNAQLGREVNPFDRVWTKNLNRLRVGPQEILSQSGGHGIVFDSNGDMLIKYSGKFYSMRTILQSAGFPV